MLLLGALDAFHPEVDLLPEVVVVVALGVHNFLNLEQVFLNALDFLVNLELDGPLLQNAILQILYFVLVHCKIALLFRKRS